MFNEEDQPFIYGHIPIVVARCCEFLKKEGTEAMGCLTTSGDEQRVEDLITILDTAPFTGKSLKWRYTVFDAATTLHRYLTSLPEPLIPNHIADRLITELVARRFMPALPPPQDLNILIKLYKDAIYKLPPLNFQLLMYLLDMFWRFKINAAKNGAYGDVILRYYHTVFFQQVDGSPEVTMEQESAVLFLIDYQARFLYGIPGENGVMPRRTENAMSVQISARWGWGPQRL
ncbi:Rho GTPase activation protein [Amniculicola lignicola CBS 123094]|uniref:Rho GTPase activation protein n=1 Tax=Amniculicola lignicola CBS 123094 TaxID=1392246 RepID=A0A6A5WPE0_9PLEO|nr:Rho GTPase activation protein [Amniculicola lignicola CBS 123094]